MMSTMATRSQRARAGAPASFVELCKTLYGPEIDAQEVWETVVKDNPDQADLNARRARIRNNVERGSNALGLTAAGMATGAALRDERLAAGGKIARRLYRTGQRIPAPISRIGGRTGAALAGGALAVQGANMAGDALIAGTLKATGRKKEVGKAFPKLPTLDSVANGSQKVMRKITQAAKPPAPTQPTLPCMPSPAAAPVKGAAQARAVGNAIGQATSTTTGRTGMAIGAAGTAAAGGANTQRKRRQLANSYANDSVTYGKAESTDVVFKGVFTELDEDKHLAFGWASVTKINGADVVDRQEDYIDTEEIEKAAYQYVHGSRVGGDMHRRTVDNTPHHVSDLVESMVFTDEKVSKLGLPETFPRGWWVGFRVNDEEVWKDVKEGRRRGFSIHGRGIRKDHELADAMGY